MIALLIAAGLVAAIAIWYVAVRIWYRVPSSVDEVHHATTDDGWDVALSRYRPRATPRAHPVLVCCGLGANATTYDLGPSASLACRLADLGFDAWILELRAHGRSRRRFPTLHRWAFDDHLLRDVPAGLAEVRAKTGASMVHFVGHSMGGVLLYAHLGRDESAIRSGVIVGSSLDYSASSSWFHQIKRALFLRHLIWAVPLGFFATLTAPLALRGRSKADEFNVHPTNVVPPLYRRLVAICFHSVSTRVLAQLATAFDPGGLRSADGTVRYFDALTGVTTPILALAGTADRQCPEDAARRSVDALGSSDKRLVVLGRAHGQADDYGHFDMVMGTRAPTEVWPHVEDWLVSHD